MKKKSILLSLLAIFCLNLISGCGTPEYNIKAKASNSEYGYVSGGGKYKEGKKAGLKIYSNLGCEVDYLKFVDLNGKETTITTIENKEKYDYYSIDVKKETAGSYTAYFVCGNGASGVTPPSGGGISGEGGGGTTPGTPSVQTKYTINYYLDLNNNGRYTDASEKIASELVASGEKATNIEFYGALKITGWYTDKLKTFSYNFNSGVNKNIDLYGKFENASTYDVVNGAIKNLYSSTSGIRISGNNKKINITGIAEDASFEFDYYDSTVLTSAVRNVGSTSGDKPKFYYYFEDGISSRKQLTTTVFEYIKGSAIDELLILRGVTFTSSSGVTKEGSEYKVSHNDVSYSLKINNGKLEGFKNITDNKEYTITYENVVLETINLTTTSFHTIKFASNNSDLNEALSEFNVVDKAIKVAGDSTTFNQVLSQNTELKGILKNYAYELKLNNQYGAPYIPTSLIRADITIYVNVLMTTDQIETKYNYLSNGNYTITTTIEADDEFAPPSKQWVAGDVNIASVTSKPSGMTDIVWEMFTELKDAVKNKSFEKLSYETASGKEKICIYLNSTSVIPEIEIELGSDKNIATVRYSVKKNGSYTTYINTFVFDTID